MKNLIAQTALHLLILTLVTGLLYPLATWGLGMLLCPAQAHGSLLVRNGQVIGSALLGQEFRDPRYFQGRPSATGNRPYDPMASGGSNLGPSNPVLRDSVNARAALLCASNQCSNDGPPQQLLHASASGLDPEIGIDAARFQVKRIATTRDLPVSKLMEILDNGEERPLWGLFGTARINVLKLNLDLDSIAR